MHRRRIDGHVHLIPKREPGWIDPITQYRHDAYGMLRTPLGDRRRLPPYMADSAFEAGTLMEVMEEYGVEKAVLMARLESGVPEAALDAVKRYPGRIAGAVCVEIHGEGEAQLQEWHSRGIGIVKFEMRGLNELYGKLEICDPVMMRLFGKAEELGMIVVIDPGPVAFPSYSPEQISTVLHTYPALKLVICHMGLPFYGLRKNAGLYEKWRAMISLGSCSRVWFDVTAVPDLFEEEGYPYSEALTYFKELLDICGPDRVIWGTDIPGTFRRATYSQMIEVFERCDFLDGQDKDKLFYENANQLYFNGENESEFTR